MIYNNSMIKIPLYIYRICKNIKNVQVCAVLFLVLLCFVNLAVADIDNLTLLGHNEQNPYHIMDVEVVADNAYIANGLGFGLEVYNIADPSNPQRIFNDASSAWRCRAYGDTMLFVYHRRSGVTIWDISGSGSPVQLGQYDPPGSLEALEGGALVNDILYCAVHQNGIYEIDVSNPANPQKIGAIALTNSATWNVEAQDSFLFAANGRFGLSIIGLAGGLHEVANLPLPGLANDIVLDNTVAAISLGADGFATIDITDPYNPVLMDVVTTDGCVWGSGIRDHQVITGAWRVMELFDISDPYNIAKIGWDNTKTWAHGADIRDDSLIVVADWRGMSCYEIGNDPGADIDLYPQVIDFGLVSSTKDTTVIVYNSGSATLSVSSISVPSGISLNPNAFSVQPGDSQLVTVTATGSGNVNGFVTYYSNDPDEASKTQEIYKNNTSFPQVGSLAPDFTLYGSDNNWHTLSDYQGKVVVLEFGGAW